MMHRAIIDGAGKVLNIIVLSDDWTEETGKWQPKPGTTLVDPGKVGEPGDTWDGTKIVHVDPAPGPTEEEEIATWLADNPMLDAILRASNEGVTETDLIAKIKAIRYPTR